MSVGSSAEVLASLREMFAGMRKKRARPQDALPSGPEPAN
jgi:hypothetical protein